MSIDLVSHSLISPNSDGRARLRVHALERRRRRSPANHPPPSPGRRRRRRRRRRVVIIRARLPSHPGAAPRRFSIEARRRVGFDGFNVDGDVGWRVVDGGGAAGGGSSPRSRRQQLGVHPGAARQDGGEQGQVRATERERDALSDSNRRPEIDPTTRSRRRDDAVYWGDDGMRSRRSIAKARRPRRGIRSLS